jgi:hypothetical protein
MMKIVISGSINKRHNPKWSERKFIKRVAFRAHIQFIANPKDHCESMHFEKAKGDCCS